MAIRALLHCFIRHFEGAALCIPAILVAICGPILAACVTLTFLAGCGNDQTNKSGTFFGPPQSIGDGTAKTYVTVDNAGNPTEVGIRMSAASLNGLPTEDAVPPRMLILALPAQASATAFDHVMLNWNSHGHEPAELFGKPHFDMHFYMIDPASVEKINPSSPDFTTRPLICLTPKYIPLDYVTPPGSPAENTVPAMGLHWVDRTDGFVAGQVRLQADVDQRVVGRQVHLYRTDDDACMDADEAERS